jgi:hypothetical protein
LGNESIPQVQRKLFVNAAQSSNEVVLEGLDCAFGGIAAMHTRWDQLEVDIFNLEELFQDVGTLVV